MSKSFLAKQNFIKELTIPEHIILWLNVLLSFSFFIVQLAWLKAYSQWSTWLAFFATVISIFAVMAGAKQRIICPFLGIIGSILLIFINWNARNYLMMVMYVLNIGMQTWSLIVWLKDSKDKISIKPSHAKWWIISIYLVVLACFIVFFSWMDGQRWWIEFWTFGKKAVIQPSMAERIFDACALVFMVGCLYPQLKKYDQVWYVYILNDISMLIQWCLKASNARNSVDLFNALTMIASTVCMTAVCILGIISWKKSIKSKK